MNIFGVTTWESGELMFMEFKMIATGMVRYELIEQLFWGNWQLNLSE